MSKVSPTYNKKKRFLGKTHNLCQQIRRNADVRQLPWQGTKYRTIAQEQRFEVRTSKLFNTNTNEAVSFSWRCLLVLKSPANSADVRRTSQNATIIVEVCINP